GPGKVLWIIPKCNLRIPIYLGNVRGMSASDAIHVVSLVLVRNPLPLLESSLLAIVDLLQMLLDARIDLWPLIGFHVGTQVKLGLQSYTTKTELEI
ncbi:hypothetical protein Tco_0244628, partial [Tanacetum coccineum]